MWRMGLHKLSLARDDNLCHNLSPVIKENFGSCSWPLNGIKDINGAQVVYIYRVGRHARARACVCVWGGGGGGGRGVA